METLEEGLHENAPPLVAQHMRGTFKFKQPPYTPKLRNWQTLQDRHSRNTVSIITLSSRTAALPESETGPYND